MRKVMNYSCLYCAIAFAEMAEKAKIGRRKSLQNKFDE